MPDAFLTIGYGEVRLNGALLPGILTSQRISAQVKYDESQTDGQSGKQKTPTGYEDSQISLTMDLLTEAGSTCYDKLAALNGIFRALEGANPIIYQVINLHANCRSIDRVVFESLQSAETDEEDVIQADLVLKEHLPSNSQKESDVTGGHGVEGEAKEGGESGGAAADQTPAMEQYIQVDTATCEEKIL